MSKMSEIAMLLDDQAAELGFESYEEAIAKGYEVDYEERKLVNPYVLNKDQPAWCKRLENYDREQEKAHEAWLKEKKKVIDGLYDCYRHLHGFPPEVYSKILNAIRFIEEVKSE